MAWPKLRNRRPAVSAPTFSSGGAGEAHGAQGVGPGEAAPDQAATPSWSGHQGWADSHATVAPSSGAPPQAADPLDAPFWESWAPADQSIELDDPGDGLPEDAPADDAVTDVDPRPRRSWQPVVTPVTEAGEQPQAEGIGRRLGDMAHLSGNPRMRGWQRRIIVAVIAGLVFGILLHDWRWGVTFAVLAAIADTIIRSRTVFNGPAGVKLTRAQKNTLRQLASLERKGYRAMHIVPIPDSEEQIDHLVVGPAGVFAFDSEDWDKRMPVRTSSHRQLWHGPQNMKDRLVHAQWEADQAAERLSETLGRPVSVRPVLAVYGPKMMWDVAEIRGVDTFSGPRLRKYLRRRAKSRGARPLSGSEIDAIFKAAQKAFPQAPSADPASR